MFDGLIARRTTCRRLDTTPTPSLRSFRVCHLPRSGLVQIGPDACNPCTSFVVLAPPPVPDVAPASAATNVDSKEGPSTPQLSLRTPSDSDPPPGMESTTSTPASKDAEDFAVEDTDDLAAEDNGAVPVYKSGGMPAGESSQLLSYNPTSGPFSSSPSVHDRATPLDGKYSVQSSVAEVFAGKPCALKAAPPAAGAASPVTGEDFCEAGKDGREDNKRSRADRFCMEW